MSLHVRPLTTALALCSIAIAACGGEKDSPSEPTTPAGPSTPGSPSTPSTGVALNDDFSGRALFPSDNWWNQDVSRAPLDNQSNAFIDYIGRTRTLHPDFGPPPYGIPYIGVGGGQTRVPVTFVDYGSESDAGFRGENGYPIPNEARTQSNFIEGGVPGGGTSGDRHVIIVDRDRWVLFELFATRWNNGRWEAGSGAVFDLSSNARRPEGWTSADAAGLAVLPGLVRYEEAASGREIRHAFRVTVRATNGNVWPASHRAGSSSGALPMGARLRLKASKNIASYPANVQRIFRAMQTYGLIVADNGSDMYISGAMDSRWNNDELVRAAARDLPRGTGIPPNNGPIMHVILAIEPDADRGALLRELVREYLNTDLVHATSADAAITAMTGSRPDLILASMLLSANEEQDLLSHLRATPSLRHIPVLTIPAVTSSSAIEARATGLFARFRRRRQPPVWPMYNFNAVITRIEEALEQSKLAAAQADREAKEYALHAIVEPAAEPMSEPTIETTTQTPVHQVLDSEVASSGSRAMASMAQKRARRMPVSDVPWLSTVKLAWGQSLRLLNISSSGLLVESGVRLSPGSSTKIQLDGTGLTRTVLARIVRCRVSDVSSLGVKYETAAVFERPVEELIVSEEELTDAGARLDHLVAAVKANAACGIPQAELRAAFESGVLDLITAREVRLRDVPVAENDGRESIYFTVPALEGSRAVLQVTFNANDAPGLEDFDVMTAAARSAATVLPLTGTTKHAALELQIA